MRFDELNGLKRLVFLNSFHEQRAVLSPFWPKIRLARPRIKSGTDLNREASKGVDGRDQPRQAKDKPKPSQRQAKDKPKTSQRQAKNKPKTSPAMRASRQTPVFCRRSSAAWNRGVLSAASSPTNAIRIMLVAPGVRSGMPATMMMRWPIF